MKEVIHLGSEGRAEIERKAKEKEEKERHIQIHRYRDREAGRETEKLVEWKTGRQRDRETER